MRSAMVMGVLLAVCGLAQDYPKPNGFVNDFANQLQLDAVQSLERKVRDYQRAIEVQIGVAVIFILPQSYREPSWMPQFHLHRPSGRVRDRLGADIRIGTLG